MITEFYIECVTRVQNIADYLNELDYDELREQLKDYSDVKYKVNKNGKYKSAYIYITLQGSTVWIDTYELKVSLRCGDTYAEGLLDYETADNIQCIFSEYYNSLKR